MITGSDLTEKRSSDLARPVQRLWLLNTSNGRILPWTPILAVKLNMVECTAAGDPTTPFKADDPYIIQETKSLADRISAAGGVEAADDDTLQDFGRSLTDQGDRKWKQLGSDAEDLPKLTVIEVSSRVQALVDAAHAEIHTMALSYYWKIAGLPTMKIFSFREVAYRYQRAKAWGMIGYEPSA